MAKNKTIIKPLLLVLLYEYSLVFKFVTFQNSALKENDLIKP